MDDPRSVVMVGVDAPMLRAASARGLTCHVFQGGSNRDFGLAVVPEGHEVSLVQDLSSVDQLWSAWMRSGLRPEDVLAVVTTEEFSVLPTAMLGCAIGRPSLPVDVAGAYRDKVEQKKRVAAAGVPTGRSVVVEDIRADMPEGLPTRGRLVVKPLMGGGTAFTRMVEDGDDLPSVLGELARTPGCPRTMVVETYVPGAEWLVDGVVANGRVEFFAVSRYAVPCLTAVTSGEPLRILMFDPERDRSVFERVGPFAQHVVDALGGFDGVFHLEVFDSPDGLVFGECGARRGGAMVQEQTLVKFGVDLADAALALACGLDPALEPTVAEEAVGTVFLPCPPGVLLAAPREDELLRLDGVVEGRLEVPVGFTMPVTSNTVLKLGQVCLTAPDDTTLTARIDGVLDWAKGRTRAVPVGASGVSLRERGR